MSAVEFEASDDDLIPFYTRAKNRAELDEGIVVLCAVLNVLVRQSDVASWLDEVRELDDLDDEI